MLHGTWYPGRFDGLEHHFTGWGIAGMVLMILLWAAVIVALVLGIRAIILHSRRSGLQPAGPALPMGGPVGPTATPADATATTATGGTVTTADKVRLLAILEERYVKGEIDRDEFLQRKQDLGIS